MSFSKLSTRRGRGLLAGILFLLPTLFVALSIRRVDDSKVFTLRESRFNHEISLLSPGWHWLPWGWFRLVQYPRDKQSLSLQMPGEGGERISSSEGVSVRVAAEVAYRIPAGSLEGIHLKAKGDWVGRILTPLLQRNIRGAIRQSSFARISGLHRLNLEQDLATRLGPALKEEGFTFLSIQVRSVRMNAPADLAELTEPIPGSRLLLIGLDGADWRVLDPLLQAGRLPNLAGLIASGVRSRLETVEPVLSPVVWTTAATGFLPPEHGILDFLVTDTRTGTQVPITSRHRKVRAIWNLLSEVGVRVGVVGWWATWPAERVEGYLVSDRVAYQLLGQSRMGEGGQAGKTYPPELYQKVASLVVPPDRITEEDLFPFVRGGGGVLAASEEGTRNRLDGLRTVLAATRTYEGICLALASGGYQPFQAVYFEGIDTASHLFMPFYPPRRPGISTEEYERFSGAVEAFYVYQDQVLGRLLDKASPETNVLVISDHGFRSETDRLNRESRIGYATAALWHRKYGILVANGPAFRKGVRLENASIADITPTILAFFGLPIGEDMEGRPLEEVFQKTFLDRHPLRYRASWEKRRQRMEGQVSDPVGDEALKAKLLSLGYLSQSGSLSHHNLGNALLAQGKVAEALEELQRAVQDSPEIAVGWVNLGRAYLMSGDLVDSRRALERSLELSPKFLEAEILLANVERLEGHEGAAEARLERVLLQEPSLSEAHKILGWIYLGRGEVSKAEEAFGKVIAIDPEDPEGYNALGSIYQERGQREKAEIAFLDGVKADSRFAGSYNNLALIAMDRQDWQGAENWLQRALERAPEDPIIQNNVGNLYYRTNRLEEAESHYRKAMELDPQYAEPHNGMGAIFARRNDLAAEVKSYREALEIRPDYVDALWNLGRTLVRSNRPEEAEGYLRRVVTLAPEKKPALMALVSVLNHLEKFGEAQVFCRQAVAAHPREVAFWNLLGNVSLQLEDEPAARDAYSHSLALDPEQPGIQAALSALGNEAP